MDFLQSLVNSFVGDELAKFLSLQENIQRLRATLPNMSILIDKADWWGFRDTNVAQLLNQLKDAVYDAEDLIDEFEYEELKQKVEGAQGQASQFLSSIKSQIRDLFMGSASKVKNIQGRLDDFGSKLEHALSLLGSYHGFERSRKSLRETSSFLIEREVFGRDEECEGLIKLLLQPNDKSASDSVGSSSRSTLCSKRKRIESVYVLSIVGIGGVGKTTLAQLVFNDPRVKKHFEVRKWICISDNFDVKQVIQEIIGYHTIMGKYEIPANLDSLQVNLKNMVMGKKFLFVLDDVWNVNRNEWELLCAPLIMNGLEGSVILVTTRFERVVDITGTMHQISLNGLQFDVYWDFFKKCAFGSEIPEQHLQFEAIGKKIAKKLMGSPLAAKTLGSLLNTNLCVTNWRAIMNSELWELKQGENDVLPALRLSYQYLPLYLKQCFSFCSVFPKDWYFRERDMVDLWLAEGFISSQGSRPLEHIGSEYFQELVSRTFFEHKNGYLELFTIHDLMHDVAQSVSINECFRIEHENWQQSIPRNVRYLSICTQSEELPDLIDIGNYKKLRCLLILDSSKPKLDFILSHWFNVLTNLRSLQLEYCRIKELPKNIDRLKHLRYLNLSFTGIKNLPQSLCSLYNLQIIKLECAHCRDPVDVPKDLIGKIDSNKFDGHTKCPESYPFPYGFTNLINLCRIYPSKFLTSKIGDIKRLVALQNLTKFEVRCEKGREIGELKMLTQLHGCLHITNLDEIESKENSSQAKLDKKMYLDKLILEWSHGKESRNTKNTSTSIYREVLEGLIPHPNLKMLELKCYGGDKFPSWLRSQQLPCLSHLYLENCCNIRDICFLPFITSLCLINVGLESLSLILDGTMQFGSSHSTTISSLLELYIESCPNLRSLEKWLVPQFFPKLKLICIRSCADLVSLPVQKFKEFHFLEKLEIRECLKLIVPMKMELPPSVSSLYLGSCGDLEESLPCCLQNLNVLKELKLSNCSRVSSFPSKVLSHLAKLEKLTIDQCANLRSLEGLEYLVSLNLLQIFGCSLLTQWGSIMSNGEAHRGGKTSIERLYTDDPVIIKNPFFQNPRSSLVNLFFCNSDVQTLCTGDEQEWVKGLVSLCYISIANCPNLESLPSNLNLLTSLIALHIRHCPKIEFLPDLPPSLVYLRVKSCNPILMEQAKELKRIYRSSFYLLEM